MTEMKTCPFCGAAGEIRKDKEGYYYARCSNSLCVLGATVATDPEPLIEKWNTRHEPKCHANEIYEHVFECSECGELDTDGMPNYCPNCGAKAVDE